MEESSCLKIRPETSATTSPFASYLETFPNLFLESSYRDFIRMKQNLAKHWHYKRF